jgi:hypothetical protein
VPLESPVSAFTDGQHAVGDRGSLRQTLPASRPSPRRSSEWSPSLITRSICSRAIWAAAKRETSPSTRTQPRTCSHRSPSSTSKTLNLRITYTIFQGPMHLIRQQVSIRIRCTRIRPHQPLHTRSSRQSFEQEHHRTILQHLVLQQRPQPWVLLTRSTVTSLRYRSGHHMGLA